MHQGCQVPFRISRGNVGFFSRGCSGKGPHLAIKGNLVVFLEFLWDSRVKKGIQGPSHGASRKSNLNSRCQGELGIALESLQGKWTSSRLVSRNSVFLSSGERDLRLVSPESSFHVYLSEPIEWCNGSQASCGALRGDSGLVSSPCRK